MRIIIWEIKKTEIIYLSDEIKNSGKIKSLVFELSVMNNFKINNNIRMFFKSIFKKYKLDKKYLNIFRKGVIYHFPVLYDTENKKCLLRDFPKYTQGKQNTHCIFCTKGSVITDYLLIREGVRKGYEYYIVNNYWDYSTLVKLGVDRKKITRLIEKDLFPYIGEFFDCLNLISDGGEIFVYCYSEKIVSIMRVIKELGEKCRYYCLDYPKVLSPE